MSATPDPAQVMATICGDRLAAWGALAELSDAGAAGWVAGLEDRLVRLTAATAWLQEGWRPDGALLLDGLVRRARRRGPEDVEELARDTAVAAQPGLGRLHREVARVTDLCRVELGHWGAGEADAAKTLRVEQMGLLVPGSALREEASRLAAARLPVWSPVADVVAAYLLLETGR